jgi:hypothetical protein
VIREEVGARRIGFEALVRLEVHKRVAVTTPQVREHRIPDDGMGIVELE